MKIVLIGGQCAGKTSVFDAIVKRKHSILNIYEQEFDISHAVVNLKFAQPHYDVLAALGKPKNRRFMQEFSDVAKKAWGKDVFIRMFVERLSRLEGFGYENFICDDARYKDELDACHDLGFVSVFVDAPEEVRRQRAERQGLEFIQNHNSEAEVASLKALCYHVIDNGGSREQLEAEVDNLLGAILGEKHE